MSERLYMPHAAHFICGDRCRFKLSTYVNGFIVSTVGEMANPSVFDEATGKLRIRRDSDPVEPLGAEANSLYETMVFKAEKAPHKCCPWVAVGDVLSYARYATADAATDGHEAFCVEYEKAKP